MPYSACRMGAGFVFTKDKVSIERDRLLSPELLFLFICSWFPSIAASLLLGFVVFALNVIKIKNLLNWVIKHNC